MNYNEAVQYLYNLTKHGIKLGLENIGRLSDLLGSPQKGFKSIHIAGTNGKGSTAFIIASILQSSGYRVGLFTSPHLVRFTERIRVNNREIPEHRVVELTGLIRKMVDARADLRPTFFEFITAMAFLYFSQEGVDYAVVETGMGGRFDATNILQPRITVITPIDYDHMEFLGNSISRIAFEKAGIIKKSVPVVIGKQQTEALEILLETAGEKKAEAYIAGRDFVWRLRELYLDGTLFDYISGRTELRQIKIPLTGAHQAENASLAIKTVDLLLGGIRGREGLIKDALGGIRWAGRFEIRYHRGIPFILDGAHNPRAMNSLFETITELRRHNGFPFRKLTTLVGIMSDKDAEKIMLPVLKHSDRVIVTSPSYTRAMGPEGLFNLSLGMKKKMNLRTPLILSSSLKEAIDIATGTCSRDEVLLITGSFYTVGDASALMGEEEKMKHLCESN